MMNPFNNVNLGTNFRGRSSQPAGGFNNFINGGYGNGLVINNEVINGLTNGVRNVNLNGSPFNAPTQGTTIGNSASRFETNSANQFAPILPRHNQQQPNQCGISSTVGGGNNEFSFSALRNTTSNFNNISLADDDDDIMVINNILLQQIDNCQPPSHQKQVGEEVPVNFTSMLYQDEDPEPTLTPTSQVQLNPNPSVNGEVQLNPNPFVIGQVQLNPNPFVNAEVQLNPNPVVNDQDQLNPNSDANGQLELNPTPIVNSQVQLNLSSAFNDEAHLNPNLCANDLNSNPAVNSQLELNRTANGVGNPNLSSSPAVNGQLDETTANQVGNPDFFGSAYHMEDDAPDDEQSWSLEEQGGDQQMLNSEFNNIFQSDDYSSLFDQQLPTQEGDDDFLNALMAFGDY
ncbi:hypothetical protein M0R45_037981 [Rubus argutus]|uniref:Uncharacterized protein n=1 Tax=Rubus argutus TaxID=59490 RepID=A0AAW1W1Y6_RUBAR